MCVDCRRIVQGTAAHCETTSTHKKKIAPQTGTPKTVRRKTKRMDIETEEYQLLGLPGLPGEVVAEILRAGASPSEPLSMAGLCTAHPALGQWCDVPVFDAAALPLLIGRNLDPKLVTPGGRVSLNEIARAKARRDTMRKCILYAIYSIYAQVSAPDGYPQVDAPLVPFDPSMTEGDWARLLFSIPAILQWDRPLFTVRVDVATGTVALSGIAIFDTAADVNDVALGAMNRALSQSLIRAVVNTGSTEVTPALCASIDLQKAYPVAPGMHAEPVVYHDMDGAVLNIQRLAYQWYPRYLPHGPLPLARGGVPMGMRGTCTSPAPVLVLCCACACHEWRCEGETTIASAACCLPIFHTSVVALACDRLYRWRQEHDRSESTRTATRAPTAGSHCPKMAR
jgi:hypothetical protein